MYDPAVALDPKEAERRAAALEALRRAPPPAADGGSFWSRHGRTVIALAGLALGLWLFTRAVGGFLRSSVTETSRSQEELRRGLRR